MSQNKPDTPASPLSRRDAFALLAEKRHLWYPVVCSFLYSEELPEVQLLFHAKIPSFRIGLAERVPFVLPTPAFSEVANYLAQAICAVLPIHLDGFLRCLWPTMLDTINDGQMFVYRNV